MITIVLLTIFGTPFFIRTNGYPHIYNAELMQFTQAKQWCNSIGTGMSSPDTPAENEAVRQACLGATCWIAVNKHWQYEQYSCGSFGNCPLLPGQWCGGEPDGGLVGFIVSASGCWGGHWDGPGWKHAVVCDPIPTTSPTPAPTDNPTLSPTQTCEGRGLIKHINWDDSLNGNSATNLLSVINVYTDPVSLYTNINVEVEYLGFSVAELNNEMIELGTTYVIDFKSFVDGTDSINRPGNCQNRLESSFILVNKMDWWSYSELPYAEDQLGNDNYLAYPSLPNYWTIESKYNGSCQPILYSASFSLNDLLNCKDYDGNKLYEISETANQITLSWTINVDIVSPRVDTNDNDIYRVYPLDKHNIVIKLTKSNNIISSTLSQQVFFITVDSLSVIDDVINIIFYTESADYIFLTNPILVSTPLNNYQHSLTTVTNTNCIFSSSYTCGQRWKLMITDFEDQCPIIDLRGDYMIKFDISCDNSSVVCNNFLSNNNGSDVLLVSDLNYMNTLCASTSIDITLYSDQQVYTSNTFNQQQNIYGIGYPIYVEIISQIVNNSLLIPNTLNIFDIVSVDIYNAYVCSPLQSNIPITSCLDPVNVDANGPYHLIANGVPNANYNVQIIQSGIDNLIRFSFDIFETGSQQIYIHSQILLTIQSNGVQRRVLLDSSQSNEFNKFEYVIQSTSISDIDDDIDNDTEKDANAVNYMIWLFVGIGAIILFILIILVFFVLKLNSKNQKLKQQIENDHVNITVKGQSTETTAGEETKYVE